MEILNNKENIAKNNTTMNKFSKHLINNIIDKVEVREMSISDLDTIKDILFTDFDDFWNYNIFKSELENENSKYIVAIINNEIIGFAGIWQVADEAHITNIVTKRTYRNQGIASLLLKNLINICKQQKNINSLTLEVHEENIIAQKLYKKFGLEVLGERKKYYNNEKSAIIMTLLLQ